jgi:hypothetical protein
MPDGRRITYARWQYEQQVQQEAVIAQVNELITQQASAVATAGASLGQQEFGGLLRTTIPALLDQYGNINATAAIDYYDKMRAQWTDIFGAEAVKQIGRKARRSAQQRYATAITGAKIKVATNADAFVASYAPTYNTVAKTDAVLNFAMKVRAKYGHEASVQAMNNALTREVAMYHRDTVLFNSALDPYVEKVQRVAQATACEFCRLMALGSTDGSVRLSSYAAKFHDNCHCTIQPLFAGDRPVRPPYYDQFEDEYVDARSKGKSTENILNEWRKLI